MKKIIAILFSCAFLFSSVGSGTAKAFPSKRAKVVRAALKQVGTDYTYGGASSNGFDCSGLVVWAYHKVGVSLPHHAASMKSYGKSVSKKRNLKTGDLVFFNHGGHVGIYTKRGKFVHSSSGRDKVLVSRLTDNWYNSTYDGARRLIFERNDRMHHRIK